MAKDSEETLWVIRDYNESPPVEVELCRVKKDRWLLSFTAGPFSGYPEIFLDPYKLSLMRDVIERELKGSEFSFRSGPIEIHEICLGPNGLFPAEVLWTQLNLPFGD